MNIGFAGSGIEREFEIDEEELEGLRGQELTNKIVDLAYIDARQYIDIAVLRRS